MSDVTARQTAFFAQLLDEAVKMGRCQPEVVEYAWEAWGGADRKSASAMIDSIIQKNRAFRAAQKAQAPAGAAPAVVDVKPGLYLVGADTVIRLTRGQSGRVYGKRLVLGVGKGQFVYEPGLPALVAREGRTLAAEDAKKLGHRFGTCVACGLELSTADSMFNGYGAKCAKNHGWEYAKAPKVAVAA